MCIKASTFILRSVLLSIVTLSIFADYENRDSVKGFVNEVAKKDGFDPQELLNIFEQVEKKQRIIDLISRPAEKAKPWYEYREIFVTAPRIAAGVEFWEENEAALNRAGSKFGIPIEIIVAVIGVETNYGRNKGSFRVMDALSTLAFDYPPRARFFRSELRELLLLAREENKDPLELIGSYAGAMGYGQFIPSSFRAYAIDFDGDGARDIWSSQTDAIGSVANYFSRHGWDGEGPIAVPVTITDERADQFANQGLKPKRSIAELRKAGVEHVSLPDQTLGALFRLEGRGGWEYWLGLHDFYVVTRYNHSHMYALAVVQLSTAVRSGWDDVRKPDRL
ncbi:MAG TPA: lytic murein transglycosylase B [Pseudomonadales bacterium]|nr:lytic murein transglycosylase B [Gammaproteobacteria bacterium]HIM36289.1 lytic murein transglycosylase B [Pseudomonadales bacterium]